MKLLCLSSTTYICPTIYTGARVNKHFSKLPHSVTHQMHTQVTRIARLWWPCFWCLQQNVVWFCRALTQIWIQRANMLNVRLGHPSWVHDTNGWLLIIEKWPHGTLWWCDLEASCGQFPQVQETSEVTCFKVQIKMFSLLKKMKAKNHECTMLNLESMLVDKPMEPKLNSPPLVPPLVQPCYYVPLMKARPLQKTSWMLLLNIKPYTTLINIQDLYTAHANAALHEKRANLEHYDFHRVLPKCGHLILLNKRQLLVNHEVAYRFYML